MHVLILGLGISGRAAHAFCQERGDHVSVYDDQLALNPIDLDTVELIVKSPGIPFTHPLVQEAQKKGILLVGEIDLAFQEIKGKTVYAVTGSNGKTTTTLLAAHLLNTAGKKALAVGNVGVPLLSQIHADIDYFIVELSSFQLESMHASPLFEAAVLLNITPNHLDRHKTFEAYMEAKLRIRDSLKEGGKFFVSRQLAEQYKFTGTIFDIETISSLGYRGEVFYPHDLQNIAAAAALTGVDALVVERGLKSFKKPPHRIEFVRNFKGITFINDSKATSVDAVTKAVEAIPSQIILIAGGVDKGGAYDKWLPLFRKKVRKVFVIGEAAGCISSQLMPDIEVEEVVSLDEAVKIATQFAQSGETVLLSPGCSSYDQFRNYEQRGERFKKMVCALEEILS